MGIDSGNYQRVTFEGRRLNTCGFHRNCLKKLGKRVLTRSAKEVVEEEAVVEAVEVGGEVAVEDEVVEGAEEEVEAGEAEEEVEEEAVAAEVEAIINPTRFKKVRKMKDGKDRTGVTTSLRLSFKFSYKTK
mmetsp:Transcript_35479/g.86009  ORF Transcript_35479/g.86009 Transcript_35479/m.86009 type:complete len:131 (+) Transcript_35479:206-598(+)